MKRIILTLLTALSLVVAPSMAFSGNALADDGCSGGGAKNEVLKGIHNTTEEACNDNGVSDAIAAATNILTFVVGAAAIIAIISGAFKYITSGGDATKVANAKHTILYALVGIAIVALAQFIIRFVFTSTNSAVHNCANGQHYDMTTSSCVQDK